MLEELDKEDYKIDDVSYNRITIEFTWRCNLNCPYCYVQFDRQRSLQDMNVNNLDALFKFLDSLKDSDIKWELLLAGGEPLLVPHILNKFLEGLANEEYENIKVLNLLTNGTIWNKETVEGIKKTKKTPIIAISIHNNLDNPTFWDIVKKYMKEFSPVNVRFTYVVSYHNINTFSSDVLRFRKRLADIIYQDFPSYKSLLYEDFLKIFNLQPDVIMLGNFTRELADIYLRNLKEYYMSLYEDSVDIKSYISHILKTFWKKKEIGICGVLYKIYNYIKIYPNFYISSCGFMPYHFVESTDYFKKMTIYDIIENPKIINKPFYTEKGLILSRLYAKLSYKKMESYGKAPKYFQYCPIKSLFFRNNNMKLGILAQGYLYFHSRIKNLFWEFLQSM